MRAAKKVQVVKGDLVSILAGNDPRVYLGLMGVPQELLEDFAKRVKERGVKLHDRYDNWRRHQQDRNVTFQDWIKTLVPRPRLVPPPAPQLGPVAMPSDKPAAVTPPQPSMRLKPSASIDLKARKYCTDALRRAGGAEEARYNIVTYLKGALIENPKRVICDIRWTARPELRSAFITPDGYATYTIEPER